MGSLRGLRSARALGVSGDPMSCRNGNGNAGSGAPQPAPAELWFQLCALFRLRFCACDRAETPAHPRLFLVLELLLFLSAKLSWNS